MTNLRNLVSCDILFIFMFAVDFISNTARCFTFDIIISLKCFDILTCELLSFGEYWLLWKAVCMWESQVWARFNLCALSSGQANKI